MAAAIAVTAVMNVSQVGGVVVAAQQSATLALRNGQTLMGDLVDLGAAGFTFRVNGQDREIARREISVIDFGGADMKVPEAVRNLSDGNVVVLLRNGDVLTGEFYDVSGTRPLRLTLRTTSGERIVDAGDARYIYMTRVEGTGVAGAPAGPTGPPAATVAVSSRQRWTSTGITVREGQTLYFNASGEITFSPRNHRATVVGSVDNLMDTTAPMPRVSQGALIGRIGSPNPLRGQGTVFAIGNQTTLVMPAAGQLFLGVNDSGLDDNRGDFRVELRVAP